MPDQREVLESPLDQGALEALAYQFDFSGAGVVLIEGTPACAVVRSDRDKTDVSASTMLTTLGTVAGLVVTTPIVSALEAGQNYRLYCHVTHDGNQLTTLFCTLKCKP